MMLAICLHLLSAVTFVQPPLTGAVIVVDPGHGGQTYSKSYTGGTRGVASKLTESDLNLRVSFELAKQLRAQGATVFLTREADHRLSREGSTQKEELHARIDFFEHHACHFFISVHHNAAKANVTGHTTLYKHNASDDTLYESLARIMNDALVGAVPGPKLNLIKGSYYILRETSIPGTITEAGFMTNRAFDDLCNTPSFPRIEAEALTKGAITYWSQHKPALMTLREKLKQERDNKPRDAKSLTAIALNPAYQEQVDRLQLLLEPTGWPELAKLPQYVERFRETLAESERAGFQVKADFDGQIVRLTGSVANRQHHDDLLNVLVAMKLYALVNEISIPKSK